MDIRLPVMRIEVIPVIEIGYNYQDGQPPGKHPYWEHGALWDEYHMECRKKAGFKDKLSPYLSGSSFYRLADISDSNLKKLTIDHTHETKDESCCFSGGYVLRIDNQDMLFPQCCGELADIHFWEKTASGQESYYEGHPAPKIRFNGNSIYFDLTTNEFGEFFQPTPLATIFQVDKTELEKAVEITKRELAVFGGRLKQINEEERLNITNIDQVLIWGNDNYKVNA